MSQSEVDIANRALIRLGMQTINAATDNPKTFSSAIANGDTKNSTSLLNIHFDEWKKELLRSHPWNFAITRMTLINPQSQNPSAITIKEISHANPVVVDLTPSDSQAGYDHNLYDYDVIEIKNSLYTNLNNKKFYVYRGTGAARTNGSTTVTLYQKLKADGSIPSDGSASTGNSADTTGESAITWTSNNRYNTGTANSVEKSEFDYEYTLPTRIIKLINVLEIPEGDEYKIQRRDGQSDTVPNKVLLCNVSDLVNIEYIEDIAIGNYDHDRSFLECLSNKIAWKLSETLLKTATVTREIKDEYVMSLSQAKAMDAQENSPVMDFHSTWADEMRRSP